MWLLCRLHTEALELEELHLNGLLIGDLRP
jgi:hypothetical protein